MRSKATSNGGTGLPKQYMTRPEAAKYLGVAPRTISEWQSRGVIPFLKLGRKCVRFRTSDLDRAMDRFMVEAH